MIYVDESIQHDLGYICVGFVHCETPPDGAVRAALAKAGLIPGQHEYKSGARMGRAVALQALREDIGQIALQCKLGLYIAPVEERPSLLAAVVRTAEELVARNRLSAPQVVFVDGGIVGNVASQAGEEVEVVSNCDSKQVLGIQVADYVAYHSSYLLKCALEGKSKSVLVEIPNHPKSDEEVELDWLMRTELRRSFFVEERDIEQITGDDWFFKLAGYGAFFSERLSSRLALASRETFNSMYFGCVW